MSTLAQYIQYWKDLVSSHKFIKDFYRLNTTEIDDALRNKIKYPFFQLYDYDGEIGTNEERNKFWDVQKCSFVIFDTIKLQDYNDEHAKLSLMKKWGLGLLAKLYEDTVQQVETCPLAPYMLDEASIKYYITDFEKENCKGVLFEFDLVDYNFDLVSDPNDFN